jgi:release factor glutamine methyltransferase
MDTNQAFTILQDAGGVHAARIITENKDKISKLWVWLAARRLRRGIPVAKIIHKKWFYGLPFYTNRHTLDPRPDSETLVEAVLKDWVLGTGYRVSVIKNQEIRILDLGTGTGCLVAAIVQNMPNAHGVGIDKSFSAVRVARRNVKNLGLSDKIEIKRGNFHHPSSIIHYPFDIIVSNPPYIAFGDGRVDAGAAHDPKMALYAANNGLAAYQAIAQNARKWLRPGGRIYLEIGAAQGPAVRDIFIRNGWGFERGANDLSDIERVLVFLNH